MSKPDGELPRTRLWASEVRSKAEADPLLGTLALRQEAEALLERRGEQWEGPLCEAFSVHNQTTRMGPE